jgi:hypothetical protein
MLRLTSRGKIERPKGPGSVTHAHAHAPVAVEVDAVPEPALHHLVRTKELRGTLVILLLADHAVGVAVEELHQRRDLTLKARLQVRLDFLLAQQSIVVRVQVVEARDRVLGPGQSDRMSSETARKTDRRSGTPAILRTAGRGAGAGRAPQLTDRNDFTTVAVSSSSTTVYSRIVGPVGTSGGVGLPQKLRHRLGNKRLLVVAAPQRSHHSHTAAHSQAARQTGSTQHSTQHSAVLWAYSYGCTMYM